MDTELFEKRIKGILVLHKEENVVGNLLAILGLMTVDFSSPATVQAAWDADSITIMAKTFSTTCTCHSTNDPKVRKVDGVMHSNRCDLSMADVLIRHRDLKSVEPDERGVTFDFSWPRDISPFKNVICARFRELQDAILWSNFSKAWAGVMSMLPDQIPAEDDDSIDEPEEIVEVKEDPDMVEPDGPTETVEEDNPDMACSPDPADDFDDLDVLPPAENVPAVAPTDTKIDPAPAIPDVPKRKRGRPSGTTDSAKKIQEFEKHEVPASAFTPTSTDGKPTILACIRFAEIIQEECSRISEIAREIAWAKEFPLDQVRGVKESLDRLALRSAHMEYRGGHDRDDPQAINPLIETTLANVTAVATVAVRDLGLAPELPSSWDVFKKSLKEAVDVSDSMFDIISQTGAGPAIRQG